MDEMTAVRDLRSDAPAARRADLVAGRERLLTEARQGRRARRLRGDWRLAAAGATAITMAAVIGTQVVGGQDGIRPGGSAPRYTIELGSAKGLLNRAADAIEARPGTTAREGQWIYTKTVETNLTDDEKPGPQTDEDWTRYADPAFENGRQGDDHSPREQYEFLRSLPDDPEKVRARAVQFYSATDPYELTAEHGYRALTAVLSRSYPYDPEGLAKVYRALAAVPGVRAADVTDVTGRDAVAVYLPGKQPSAGREEILLDPVTFLYRGYRYVSGEDEQEWQEGAAVISGARTDTAVVDRKGVRP
ncbi:CU044_5270 family protein [Streptomyces sp. NPDC093094]|uniref:CU044_5270 family protein n=1 Tax=Streptomyces sp. NPDC093094 TaxID=3366026 RepID=UPI00380FA446